jgi:multicomponent Na+:H+ antiporter subunit B
LSARNRNLFAVIVLSGLYSFLMATVLVALDAVDVAMTEASVGAGVSTVLLLGALIFGVTQGFIRSRIHIRALRDAADAAGDLSG